MATPSIASPWKIPWTEWSLMHVVHAVAKSQTGLSDWAHTRRQYSQMDKKPESQPC